MTASRAEAAALADQLLEALGTRLRAGQLVIHFSEGVAQRVEVNNVYHFKRQTDTPLRRTDGSST